MKLLTLIQRGRLVNPFHAGAVLGRSCSDRIPVTSHGNVSEENQGKIIQPKAVSGFINERLLLYEKLRAHYEERLTQRVLKESRPINIFSAGRELRGESWKTTPLQVALQIRPDVAHHAVCAKVNGDLYDMNRPLEGDAAVEFVMFDSREGQSVFWHSSAHILGLALEQFYGGLLCSGPSTEDGFFYDVHLSGSTVLGSHLPDLEAMCRNIIKQKLPFQRIEVTREDLLDLFKYNKFKMRVIEEKVETSTTIYRCGSLIDLCRGPHVRHTGQVKALKLIKNSSAFWKGDPSQETLQRVSGTSFPDSKQLKEWEKIQEEARNRDHRKIGLDQSLFFFHDLSPGSCFFLPRGAHIYNVLIDFIKGEYRKRGFTEVITPNMYNNKLWEKSGHWEHYGKNMFSFTIEDEMFSLKPMNCPGHCLMFDHRPRSWRELPLRLADFGVLHRNELSGALSGLTRVRRFQQDDAHIFCSMDQLESEISGCLDFVRAVYSVFGFTFKFYLSTRPEQFLGDLEVWNKAEEELEKSLNSFGLPWELNPGDGAFYGPKIDIQIQDAMGRYHQCATIQLDFQLPIRFNLHYMGKVEGTVERPVMIHRAVLGSVERMLAILVENYGGKWPLWLSPFQVMVIPVGASTESYAHQVQRTIHERGFMVDVDANQGTTLNKKIRKAQLAQYNFILVVGEKEKENMSVNVRTRDSKQHGEHTVAALTERLAELRDTRVRNAEEMF
ncbi:threonine--tRNA ligase, mitochondrial [Pelobates cultripes]|uniref:threonine--tRNA ligase n=1 Tax=Pelobates cultripes TaxID=61616 RepID=A0AAD1TGQ9_PELCU|nr:threonine--tRNA ligase, mitochondrial [Pelobates cultripes]